MLSLLAHSRQHLSVFRRDERGVSAIEFAFILPLMVTMYLGAVDISQVLTADRKITTLASTAADLVAQAKSLTAAELNDIYNASVEIVSPFPAAGVTIVVTSIELDAEGDPQVDWSNAFNGTPRGSVSDLSIPEGMIDPGGSVIFCEVSYLYDSIITKFVGQDFQLSDRFFLRPRQSEKVEYTG